MKNLSTKNENMGKDFFSKDTIISKFTEAHDTIHKGFTLITGENNENKRGFINNMLVGSCGKNPTIFVDTRGLMDDDSLDLISSHRLVVGEVCSHNRGYYATYRPHRGNNRCNNRSRQDDMHRPHAEGHHSMNNGYNDFRSSGDIVWYTHLRSCQQSR